MKRVFYVVLLVLLMAAAMVAPASAQDTATEDDAVPWGVFVWEEDEEAEILACQSSLGLYQELFNEYELWQYVEEFPVEVLELITADRFQFYMKDDGTMGLVEINRCCRKIHGCLACYTTIVCDLPHPPYCRTNTWCAPCWDCSSC